MRHAAEISQAKHAILTGLRQRGGRVMVADVYEDLYQQGGFPLGVISAAISVLIADGALLAADGILGLAGAADDRPEPVRGDPQAEELGGG